MYNTGNRERWRTTFDLPGVVSRWSAANPVLHILGHEDIGAKRLDPTRRYELEGARTSKVPMKALVARGMDVRA